MNAVGYVDELVKEYLLWRGFTTTMLQFDVDRQRDRTKSFRVAKVVEQLFAFVDTCDLDSLLEFWRYLEVESSTTQLCCRLVYLPCVVG
jgi:4-alpha-glucanotransferase